MTINILKTIALTVFADELILSDMGEMVASKYDDSAFDTLKDGAFLPRLQLMTSASKQCKSGDFPINCYAYIQDQDFKDLGKNVDVLICAWRPKAMSLGGTIITSYEQESDTFKQIQAKSNQKNSGCMWGYDFLVWVPATESFASYFCGSKTARREAPNVKARMHNRATLGSHEIKGDEFTWYGPTTSDCSTPFNMPGKEAFKAAVEKFENPSEEGPELAPTEETGGRAQ